MKIAQIRFRLISLALLALATVGCSTSIFNNFVDERIPQNASNIYTFSFAADIPFGNLIEESLEAEIVINGETHAMQPAPNNSHIFTYDYAMPAGVREVRYYYVLRYDYINQGKKGSNERFSTHENYGRPYIARLINRYPIQLVSSRGHVGDEIAVVGTGFSELDTVMVGDAEAETTFHSPNSIDFLVPPLGAGRSYNVSLQTADGELDMGTFRVDAGNLTVTPESVTLASGDVTQLTFVIDGEAPSAGLPIAVTTDIPASVIMPEVVIPGGYSSTVVTLEGGEPGSGELYVEVPGYSLQTIDLTVE